jgi:AsmA family protein
MSVTGRRSLRYGVIASVVLAALVLLVVFFPWNAVRGPLASYLGHRLHREVAINGDLRVRLGFPTQVEVDDFSIANAPWSDLQPMAHAARIALTFDLPSLFHFTPDTIRLIEPRVVLEKNQAGEANWRFGGKGSGAPAFGDISIDNGTLRYRDPTLRGDITIAVHTVTSRENTPDELRFDGRGTLRGDPFTITGGGHGVSALRRVNDP